MEKLPLDADTVNALFDALGATVMSLAQTLPPAQRAAFASNLARLAAAAEQAGRPTLETMLIDLHAAAR